MTVEWHIIKQIIIIRDFLEVLKELDSEWDKFLPVPSAHISRE